MPGMYMQCCFEDYNKKLYRFSLSQYNNMSSFRGGGGGGGGRRGGGRGGGSGFRGGGRGGGKESNRLPLNFFDIFTKGTLHRTIYKEGVLVAEQWQGWGAGQHYLYATSSRKGLARDRIASKAAKRLFFSNMCISSLNEHFSWL
jgi:hypothetical protein